MIMGDFFVSKFAEQVQASQEGFIELLDQADRHTLYQPPSDDGWTIAQILMHIAEARQFFIDETSKVIASPGARMGRTIDHPGRLKAVEENRMNSPGQMRLAIIESYSKMIGLLRSLNDDDLLISGEHVKFGTQSLGEFIQHFIVEHDQAHVEQARALMRAQRS
jgi:uncharacterized damage-inducible protein DinB